AFERIGLDLELREALAGVLGDEQRPDLDPDQEAVAVDHDILDMADARRRRKAPFVHAWHAAQRRKLAPVLTGILAEVEMRRQRADTDHLAPAELAAARRPPIEMNLPPVDPAPRHAASAP